MLSTFLEYIHTEAAKVSWWRVPFHFLWLGLKAALKALWRFTWFRRAAYLTSALVVIWATVSTMTIYNVLGLNTYEEGWQEGTLADYSVSNRLFSWFPFLPPGWLFPTGEGDLLLGDASSINATLYGKKISPSKFSSTMGVFNANSSMVTQSVAMHYRQLRYFWFLGGLTDIRVDRFEKVDPTAPLPATCSESRSSVNNQAYGYIGGKIVAVASVGNPWLWKTHEVIIHAGGTEYKEMSVVDDDIYQCAVAALKTGQSVRIAYDNRIIRDPVTQNTTYALVGISKQ